MNFHSILRLTGMDREFHISGFLDSCPHNLNNHIFLKFLVVANMFSATSSVCIKFWRDVLNKEDRISVEQQIGSKLFKTETGCKSHCNQQYSQ
jgi:hypothetical protein